MRTIAHRMAASAAAVIAALALAAAAQAELPGPVRDALDRWDPAAGGRQTVAAEAERAVRAGVPAEDVAIIISRSVDRGADPGTAGRLLGTAASTQEQGLPARPVVNRIQQGLAKGVPADQVASAADRLAGRLREAKPLVDEAVGKGVAPGSGRDREYALETVARALERGMPEKEVRQTGAAVAGQKGSVQVLDKAVGAMTSLVEGGMKPEAAARIVQDAVKRGSSEKDLSRLERDVTEGMKKERRDRDSGRRDDRRDDRKKSGRDDSRGSGSGRDR